MMKYVINHRENFRNHHIAFATGFFQTSVSLMIEVMTLALMANIENINFMVIAFLCLSSLSNIPKIFYGSLADHKFLKVKQINLKISAYRSSNPTCNASYDVKAMRYIYKTLRMFFCCYSYYFMPFTVLIV